MLILIRGLPGSGKSTEARRLLHSGLVQVHLEADMYHLQRDGNYLYDVDKAAAAHAWCLDSTRIALALGNHVVVSNTFVTRAEAEPYFDLSHARCIVEVTGKWKSTHNVPDDVIATMRERWELIVV